MSLIQQMLLLLSLMVEVHGGVLDHCHENYTVKVSICKQLLEQQSILTLYLNPLPVMPILGSSNSAANKDIRLKIWTNGDTIT